MDQISRPMLIALLAVVGLAAVWMLALRPGAQQAAAPAPVTAPGAAGLGRAIDKAHGASGASDRANGRIEKATGEAPAAAPATPAAKAPSKPAAHAAAPAPAKPAVKGPAAPVLRALDRGNVVVLLFAGEGADDANARRAVRGARGHGIFVRVAPISRLADYAAVTRDVQVLAAPTVLVIGPDRKARPIVGLTDEREIRAVIGDARARPRR